MKYLTSDSLNSLFKPFSGWFDNNYSASVMRTDVRSNDKEYTLSIDLPGILAKQPCLSRDVIMQRRTLCFYKLSAHAQVVFVVRCPPAYRVRKGKVAQV